MVANPYLPFVLLSSCSNVAEILLPLQPNGWPMAMAPPFTFTLLLSNSSSRTQAMDWDANASFNSIKSRSFAFKPARCKALRLAGIGPTPIMLGSTPAMPTLSTLAIGCKLKSFTASSLANNNAAAPSLMPAELPAVTEPSFIKAGFNAASFSKLVCLGCSSMENKDGCLFSVISTGTISSFHLPAFNAAKYFSCDANANASCSSRLIFHCLATFSAVSPML